MTRRINILGATGSVGQACSDVIKAQASAFDVQLLTAHSNRDALTQMQTDLGAKSIATEYLVQAIYDAGKVDMSVAAIAGMAGLEPLLAAIEMSDYVAIANKEPLVAAGPQVLETAQQAGCQLLPLDSEHNAIFQVFDIQQRDSIKRLILTGSGGPFRLATQEQLQNATKQQALAHPNWSMGEKITIDSATLMNKTLEIIEAAILFDMPIDQVELVIHPQSIVHSMVEYSDGSVLAQMGASDMRTPIANILLYPNRAQTPGQVLDFTALKQLDFEAPDAEKFPAVSLAYSAYKAGQYACIAMNAANEVAVHAFLDGEIAFLDIVTCVQAITDAAPVAEFSTIIDVISYDQSRRADASAYIKAANTRKQTV